MSQKIAYDFHSSLNHFDIYANFNSMEKGSIQLILQMANFILKDPSVNLSHKEVALKVADNILKSGNENVRMFDLIRLTISMLRTNYMAGNLGAFL